jgi:serine phosphatase RsbU (regulator of sigma subunit)
MFLRTSLGGTVVAETERRVFERTELDLATAIGLLEEVAPHELPDVLVTMAGAAAGCRVALYVIDIGGCVMRLAAGGDHWPRELAVRQALGPELARGRMGDLQRAVDDVLGGATAVPLWLRGRAVAVLVCERRPEQALEPLARQAAAAIELADRYTDVLHRARRVRSTTPAAEVQENLLPPRYARLDDAELAAGIVPAYEVGGDWYDYAQNPEGTWLAVADAAGKGPASAGTSTVALGALRAARRAGMGLSDSARLIDQAIRQLADNDAFVTAVLAHWDQRTSTLSWLRFGHPLPFLLTAQGELTALDASAQLPLGLLDAATDPVPATLRLDRGDRLLVTSDGVWERRTATGHFFQEEGIRRACAAADAPGAVSVATAVVEAVVNACGEAPRDDATVLVLARDPA